jgi:hypothetical protein
VLVRFPSAITYRDRQGRLQPVEWVAADLNMLRRYAPAFGEDQDILEEARERLRAMGTGFGVRTVKDGVVILQRGGADSPGQRDAQEAWLR